MDFQNYNAMNIKKEDSLGKFGRSHQPVVLFNYLSRLFAQKSKNGYPPPPLEHGESDNVKKVSAFFSICLFIRFLGSALHKLKYC